MATVKQSSTWSSAWPSVQKAEDDSTPSVIRALSAATTTLCSNSSRDSSPDSRGLQSASATKAVADVGMGQSRGRSLTVDETLSNPPVHNTFIHYRTDEEVLSPAGLSRCASAPGLLACPSDPEALPLCEAAIPGAPAVEASERMIWEHENNDCRPCAYFLFKPDGCRNGHDCEFCHLCTVSDIKKRKRERAKAMKARWTGGGRCSSDRSMSRWRSSR